MKHKYPLIIVITLLFILAFVPLVMFRIRTTLQSQFAQELLERHTGSPVSEAFVAWKTQTSLAAVKLGEAFGEHSGTRPLTFTLGTEKFNGSLPPFVKKITYNNDFQLIEIVLHLDTNTWEELFAREKEVGERLRVFGIEPCAIFIVWTPEDTDAFTAKAGAPPSNRTYFCREEGSPNFR